MTKRQNNLWVSLINLLINWGNRECASKCNNSVYPYIANNINKCVHECNYEDKRTGNQYARIKFSNDTLFYDIYGWQQTSSVIWKY